MRAAVTVFAAFLVSASAAASGQGTQPQDPSLGEQTFQTICSACHSVLPPHKAAPPMAHVAARYLRLHRDTSAAATAIAAYIREPAAERSAMPPHIVQRFGLMPALGHLPEAQLAAAARYVLTLADSMGRR